MAVITASESADYNAIVTFGAGAPSDEAAAYHDWTPGSTMRVINRVWDTVLADFVTWTTTGFVDNAGQRYPRGAASFASDATAYEVYEISFTRPQ